MDVFDDTGIATESDCFR